VSKDKESKPAANTDQEEAFMYQNFKLFDEKTVEVKRVHNSTIGDHVLSLFHLPTSLPLVLLATIVINAILFLLSPI
jgi:hypothetical protein